MSRFLLNFFLLIAVAAPALAAPVKTRNITFASGPDTVVAYLATPQAPGKYPALVVIHDDWGLTDWVKEQTRRLAGEGYVALAVDLYRGEVAHDPSLAYELMVDVPPERALRDLKSALDLLAARPDVNKDKLGAIGWSMGGKWAIELAIGDRRVAACVVNYGPLPEAPSELEKIRVPVLGLFGGDDRTVTPDDVAAFSDRMDTAHKSVEVKVYRNAGHGFLDSENKLGYREGAADDAWQRTITFLNRYLK